MPMRPRHLVSTDSLTDEAPSQGRWWPVP